MSEVRPRWTPGLGIYPAPCLPFYGLVSGIHVACFADSTGQHSGLLRACACIERTYVHTSMMHSLCPHP